MMQMPAVSQGFDLITESNPAWRFGWAAGVGAEARVAGSPWLARLEYLHYDFGDSGSDTFTTAFSGLVIGTTSGAVTADVARGGLSYQFGTDGGWAGASGATRSSTAFAMVAGTRPAATATWNGFYIGAHAGSGWAHDPFTTGSADIAVLSDVDSRGAIGGFQAGANRQMGRIVGGLELDLTASAIKGAHAQTTSGASHLFLLVGVPAVETLSQTDRVGPLASVRGRLGFLVGPDTLLYGTAGVGWARFTHTSDFSATLPFPFSFDSTTTVPSWRSGWVAGIGGEQRLGATDWFGRLEYLHYDFGASGNASGGNGVAPMTSGHLTADVMRAGLSLKLE
jgi:outer membrane immunogenic protein